jgi:PPM family protein phosphatase
VRTARPVARRARQPPAPQQRRPPRFAKALAALFATGAVLFLVGGGGYLATRQLYFLGTNSEGIVTIYRGLPYDLPAGIHLYETFYVSGVPAQLVPADRRSTLLNHQLRSESDAEGLVHDLELGQLTR